MKENGAGLAARSEVISAAAGVAVVFVGSLVLVGWLLGIDALKSISPTFVTMKANTAVGLVLAGTALWLQSARRGAPWAGTVAGFCSVVVALIGALTLSQYVFGWDLGIDQLLFNESAGAVGTSNPGRMAPTTALNFTLFGLGLLLSQRERGYRASWLLVLPAASVAALAALGYAYGDEGGYSFSTYTKMALHTSLAFMVLALGLLLVRPERGVMAIVLSDTLGGVIARRLLPLALVLLPAVGWVRLLGEQAELYSREFGLALFVLANVVLFTAVVSWNANSLHHVDVDRRRGEEALRLARDELEDRVRERTAELATANDSLQVEIAERKRSQEALARQADELARSNAELEQFAYVASHDLQEPLRMVSNYTQLLARRYGDRLDGDAHEFIDFAVDGATRMQTLINDLLAFSRVGTRGKDPAPTDCEAVLDRALFNLQASIGESGAEVTHDPLPTVMADDVQLAQVFQNLVGNALKFRGDQPPRIHVTAERDGTTWRFSVRDNGIGIDPGYADRIFVIFQRLHGREQYPGTGIGLSICKKVVERHGGRIWVESEPGRGATFFFTVPVEAAARPSLVEAQLAAA